MIFEDNIIMIRNEADQYFIRLGSTANTLISLIGIPETISTIGKSYRIAKYSFKYNGKWRFYYFLFKAGILLKISESLKEIENHAYELQKLPEPSSKKEV